MTALQDLLNPTPTPAGNSRYMWAQSFLAQLGYPLTPQNMLTIVAWQTAEGGGGTNNPLNTTLHKPGSTGLAGNPDGVQNYPSWAEGLQANVDTIKNTGGGSTYRAIRDALSRSADPFLTAAAIEASPWAGGHYGATAADHGSVYHLVNNVEAMPIGTWNQMADAPVSGSALNPGGGNVPLGADVGGAVPIGSTLPSLGSAFSWVGPLVIKGALILGGVALVVVGLGHAATSSSAGQAAKERVNDTAKQAASAAAVA